MLRIIRELKINARVVIKKGGKMPTQDMMNEISFLIGYTMGGIQGVLDMEMPCSTREALENVAKELREKVALIYYAEKVR